MKAWSRKWVSSSQKRKQRKYRFNAPKHRQHKMIAAHLDKALRKQYGTRTIGIRKGDEVVVMRGSFRKKHGTVSSVILEKRKIQVDNIKRKKVSGQEVNIYLDPSNVKIVKLNLEDAKRLKILRKKSKKSIKAGIKTEKQALAKKK